MLKDVKTMISWSTTSGSARAEMLIQGREEPRFRTDNVPQKREDVGRGPITQPSEMKESRIKGGVKEKGRQIFRSSGSDVQDAAGRSISARSKRLKAWTGGTWVWRKIVERRWKS